VGTGVEGATGGVVAGDVAAGVDAPAGGATIGGAPTRAEYGPLFAAIGAVAHVPTQWSAAGAAWRVVAAANISRNVERKRAAWLDVVTVVFISGIRLASNITRVGL
jgi:hypothetical protein